MKIISFIIVCMSCLIGVRAKSQSVLTGMGARPTAMGRASSVLEDEWGLFNNPASISKISHTTGGYTYDRHSVMPGADRMGAFIVHPLLKFKGVAGLSFFKFGDDLYNEQLATIGFGQQMGITSLGLAVNYIQYYAEMFGTHYGFSLDFGGVSHLSEHIRIGAYVENITQSKLNNVAREDIPTRMVVGLGLQPIKELIVSVEIYKELAIKTPTIRSGLEYVFYEKLAFRTGLNMQPSAAYIGMGLTNRLITIDYALSYSRLLYFSHQASLLSRLSSWRKKRDP